MKYQQETILEMSKEGGIQSGIFNEVDMQRSSEVIPLEEIKDLPLVNMKFVDANYEMKR